MKHILIVDDDIHINKMLDEVLVHERYMVSHAYSGTEALLFLADTKPDLILLDLMLPGLSGEELLPQISDIPIIVMSAKVDVEDKVSLLLGGAVDYVTKPFDTKELLARITVALRVKTPSLNRTLDVPKGSIYGLIGKNGAGKTTLIRLICGLQEPTSGDYVLYGKKHIDKDITKSRRRMGAIVETPSIYVDLTAYENLKEQYKVLGIPSDDGISEILKLVGLENTGNKKTKNFSLGMRQRLGIAVALAGSPDFLVLDEPVNGLDPQGIIEIRELILKLNQEHGITVLISSHILDELSKLATYYGFIDNGKMIKQISSIELESKCRKCTHLKVSSTKTLAYVLDTMNIEYKILSNTEADIFEKVNISKLTTELSKKDCEVISIHEHDESLESYFVSLVGGARHE